MVKITKVYTKTGDQGQTSLANKTRVMKFNTRIVAIGTVDELNATLGVVVSYLQAHMKDFSNLIARLQKIQNELFDLGAGLSMADNIAPLEQAMDDMNLHLPPLHSFILPGGSKISAYLHIARTVCRRAERILVKLAQEETLEKYTIPYINRLSDWLFVAARFVNIKLKIDEPLWKPANKVV